MEIVCAILLVGGVVAAVHLKNVMDWARKTNKRLDAIEGDIQKEKKVVEKKLWTLESEIWGLEGFIKVLTNDSKTKRKK